MTKVGPSPPEVMLAKKKDMAKTGSDRPVLDPAALPAELAQPWLVWQCRMVAGLIRGAIFLPACSDGAGQLIAAWPNEGEEQQLLSDTADQALEEGCGVVRSQEKYGPRNQRTCDLIACPLLTDNRPAGAVAVMISTRSQSQQHAVLQLLQWGGLWMETLVSQHSAALREEEGFFTALLSAILGQQAVRLAAMETVNRMADRFGCERVSLGFRNSLQTSLLALSHVAHFDPRTQLARRIEAAMEEALDQATTVIEPSEPGQKAAVTRAHNELSGQQGHGAICTVLLPGQSGNVGALTLERAADRPFDKGTVAGCETLAGLIGPILEMKQREARPFLHKGGEAILGLLSGFLGPAHLKLKIFLVSAILLLVGSSFVEGGYRVSAPATIEGAVRQVLVAPQEGYVKQAGVRAGEVVEKGQLIAVLDDRSLQLEHTKWQSEKNKVEKEYQEALANRNRTELSILRAQIDQLDAELRLVEGKLARTRLEAPFNGVVVSGDLSQSLGAPVQIGQVLFEVAPLDTYRVVLEVDEHDVASMEAGKAGQLVMAALPQTLFPISVSQIVPVAVSSEGRNFFRVEATLDELSPLLRPGMRGVAKVDMGQRKLLWIWTHTLVDRIRLWGWSAGL
ncbi:MAG: HlyD family efflux transporter periplasmic adaptor subunit [Gammaproteobacteria bacterium]|nr:HlyD family efflux transporter periplasmic adaptor subunit [Gammaproteobacteria bacterium]